MAARGAQNRLFGTQGGILTSALLGGIGGAAGYGLHHLVYGDWSCPAKPGGPGGGGSAGCPPGGGTPGVGERIVDTGKWDIPQPDSSSSAWNCPAPRPEIILVEQNNYYPYAPQQVYYAPVYPQFSGSSPYITPLGRLCAPMYGGYGGCGPGRPISLGFPGFRGFPHVGGLRR